MIYEIKSWSDGKVLFSAEADSLLACVVMAVTSGANLFRANLSGANLSRASLSGADLSRANLSEANLSEANLSGANLSRANLSEANLFRANLSEANLFRANLSEANLFRANLSEANLSGADNINKLLTTPMYLLTDQPGKIRLYKLVTLDRFGPFNGGIKYEVGKKYETLAANTDENLQCSSGINLASLDWCLKEYKQGYKILVAEFTAADIACIPIGSDGKIRVFRCKIVGEKDLKELGVKT